MILVYFIILSAVVKSTVQYTKVQKCSCNELRWFRGRDGRDGRDGSNGKDGKDCIEGAKVPKGNQGDRGPPGEKGKAGMRGVAGPAGVKGDAGIQGPTGLKGDRGFAGSNGEKGDEGDRGPPGEKGESGMRGVAGPAGVKGDAGIQGPASLKGDRGFAGLKGEKGICDEERLEKLINKIQLLEKEVEKLKLETVKLDSKNKIPHTLLPGGFSQVNVADLQMEALHMAAAAACRGSTPSGGSGCCGNTVIPRTRGLSCTDVCKKTTRYVNCDAELSIHGKSILQKTSNPVGSFYNYGCDESRSYPAFESELKGGDKIDFATLYISYCCCRK